MCKFCDDIWKYGTSFGQEESSIILSGNVELGKHFGIWRSIDLYCQPKWIWYDDPKPNNPDFKNCYEDPNGDIEVVLNVMACPKNGDFDDDYFFKDEIKIKYCPFCGKKFPTNDQETEWYKEHFN